MRTEPRTTWVLKTTWNLRHGNEAWISKTQNESEMDRWSSMENGRSEPEKYGRSATEKSSDSTNTAMQPIAGGVSECPKVMKHGEKRGETHRS